MKDLDRICLGMVLCCFTLASPLCAGLKPEGNQYDNRWAVIVGINYEAPQETPAAVPTLKYAENDAQKFHDLLLKNYGYQPEQVRLLLGADATTTTIRDALGELWSSKVSEDDSVLIFFSGHGYGRQAGPNEPTEGLLLPADVQFRDGMPNPARVVEMKWIVEELNKWCPARHKLLIFDSCHSGAVFAEAGRGVSPFDARRIDESVFQAPGFQAMTASRELQRAADGRDGHSPFTGALLKALERLPTMRRETDPLTTTEVFSGMQLFLDASLEPGQTPRCSWLTGGQGEFHFWPEGEFPDPDVPDERIRRMLIATVPGSFGNWWFEETPWFLPGLRYEILEDDTESRSIDLELISPMKLQQAASKTRNRLAMDPRELVQLRLKHLDAMLSAKGDEWNRTVQMILDELEEVRQGPLDLEPVDLHYMAVLRHASRTDVEKAREDYELAIQRYTSELMRSPRQKPLLALCLADRGGLALEIDYDYEAACTYFLQARSVYGGITPQPFQIYLLCREAEALNRLGRTGAAKARLMEALQVARNIDPQQVFPLTAACFSRMAWLRMDWCDFAQAHDDFQSSTEILTPLTKGNSEARILVFHNQHGQAMSRRYRGDREGAIQQYRGLLQDVYAGIVELREDQDRAGNFRQVRGRMIERWINTQERLGDCSLFAHPVDAAEAADDYRRAIRGCGYLPSEKRARWESRLRYKFALALAIPETTVHDPALAEHQLGLARAVYSGDPLNEPGLAVCTILTEILLARQKSTSPAADDETLSSIDEGLPGDHIGQLREHLAKMLDEDRFNRTLSRDDLEAALFAMKYLIGKVGETSTTAEDMDSEERIARSEDIEMLLNFCRIGRRGGGDSLAFVRPYYDVAICALMDLRPAHCKELVECAWEALHGKPHFKPQKREATLVLYCTGDANYLFLDIPHSTSRYDRLPPGIDLSMLISASSGRQPLPQLPMEIRKELAMITEPLIVCWRDPVHKLGHTQPTHVTVARPIQQSDGLVTVSGNSTGPTDPAAFRFPFQLPENVRFSNDAVDATVDTFEMPTPLPTILDETVFGAVDQ